MSVFGNVFGNVLVPNFTTLNQPPEGALTFEGENLLLTFEGETELITFEIT